MEGQVLKILFNKDKAYLTSDNPMSLDQLDLNYIKGDFKAPAFWTVKIIKHWEDEKRISCKVIKYQVGETEFDENQKLLYDRLKEIKTISFQGIDTEGLLKTLSGKSHTPITPSIEKPVERYQNIYQPIPYVRKPIKQTINETFYVPLKNIQFKCGYISFEKKFKDYKKTLQLTIENSDIREEFDAVKNYFSNVLKTKKIQVIVSIEITDNDITSIDVKSPEIDRIDKHLVDNVKFDFIRSSIRKKMPDDISRNILTMDEYFDVVTESKVKSNTFYKSEMELFEDFLTVSNTKHYKHLRFLSSKHAHDKIKLRFVHKPFSFIFLVQGERNSHIIWETLDTQEATYIWHTTKDINDVKTTLSKVNDIVNEIKAHGKISYISSTNDNFRRIYHDYSDHVDGFIKWKNELEVTLI